MKIFNYTDGTKGEQIGNTKLMNSSAGWFVHKNGRVYQVELANAPEGWVWTSGATWLAYKDGEPTGDVPILPEQFGVPAICFSWGKTRHDGLWNWYVVGTADWNRAACKNGILKSTYIRDWPEKEGVA